MSNVKKSKSPMGTTWEDLEKELFTPEEIAASNVRVKLISKLIEARDAQGVSQRALAEKSGVKQPVIARLERSTNNPQLSTLIKLLHPLGYTLDIVPLEQSKI